MSKKDFIALADYIRCDGTFAQAQLKTIVDFCKSRNSAFDSERWLAYVQGQCGANGGKRSDFT